jgi:hypothetical protein
MRKKTKKRMMSEIWNHGIIQPKIQTQVYTNNMKFPFSLTGKLLIVLILSSVLFAGCTAAPTSAPAAAPTIDLNVIIDAAVKTVDAQLTADALAHPSATPLPTNTPVPPTETPVPPTATPAFTATPEFTATPTTPALSAKFQGASTYPDPKNKYGPNERFGLALGFANTGSVAWDPGSTVKLAGFVGEGTVQKEQVLETRIEPGHSAEFDFWAFGSETPGIHTWYFQLYMANGVPVPGGYGSFTYEAIAGSTD